VKRYLAFVGIGSCFATVEEFLTVVVLKQDVASYLFTLVILFPVFLTIVYHTSRLLDRLFSREATREFAHYFVYGCAGLMLEWFLMGLAPWSNPSANPALMLIFQFGMFSFWASVAFAPRLFLGASELNRKIGKRILRFYPPFFAVVYAVALSVPADLRYKTIIPLVILGYLFLNVFYIQYFSVALARRAANGSS
jgi:hypothetical protein